MFIYTKKGSFRCYGTLTLKDGKITFLNYVQVGEMLPITLDLSDILVIDG